MIKAAIVSLSLTLLLATVPAAQAQTPEQDAINRAVYIEAARITMRQKLEDAHAAQARHDLAAASASYDGAWTLATQVGPANVPDEARQIQAGLAEVRLKLARDAQAAGDLREADANVRVVLRADPSNPEAIAFERANSKLLEEQKGRMPSQEAQSRIPIIAQDHTQAGTLVQDGKLFLEMGRLDEAEAKLNAAVKIDPQNQAAYYYLNLVTEARFQESLNKRDVASRKGLTDVEQEWAMPPKGELLPKPNPYNRTNLIYTSKGRQNIYRKLELIHLDSVSYQGLPLGEVVKNLSDEAKRRDPEKRGINFIINPNAPPAATPTPGAFGAPGGFGAPGAGAIDPATGLPVATAAPTENVDVSAVSVKIDPPITDLRLADVLDAIIKVADKPIKYSVEDYAVVFSLKSQDAAPLFVRVIKVDPNTFLQGLESVTGFDWGAIAQASNSGGGGGGGGGGGLSGGGGGLSGGGGGVSGGGGSGILTIPRVNIAGSTGGQGGQQQGQNVQLGAPGGGGGLGAGGAAGGSTATLTGAGVKAVTRIYDTASINTLVRQFFVAMGVDLTPPKNLFFNDREGSLVVRATMQDLDIIETAIQVLNIAPPQVNIKTKFLEVSQNDNRALGFDWYLGNVLMNNGSMGFQGGTAPSFSGAPSPANPSGIFPTSGILPAGSDSLVTSGLRNTLNAPALGTFTGILTDPQFRVVIKALEQRDGADLLSESSVTTLSGRQTEVQVVDLRTIVIGTSANQTTGGGGGGIGGATAPGVIGSTISYPTETLPFGPSLDVVPYVCADGYTIQMTIIPTLAEFIGYDDPGQFVPQAQSASSGVGGVALPITAVLPLPHFRVRQVTTSAIVWDGQTIVLGGLIAENVAKVKDKVPVLGDLPLVGRLFRSESSQTSKKNLMIFVTPTIIDPAGNRAHSEEEMPFAQTQIPAQPKPAVAP